MQKTTGDAVRYGRVAPMLPVKDMATALAFYRDVLGFEQVFANGDPVAFVILKQDDAELHLTLQPGHAAAPFNVAHILVSNVDAVHARCVDAGCPIIKPPRDHDFGMRMFVFEDPDGNRIDVGQPVS